MSLYLVRSFWDNLDHPKPEFEDRNLNIKERGGQKKKDTHIQNNSRVWLGFALPPAVWAVHFSTGKVEV